MATITLMASGNLSVTSPSSFTVSQSGSGPILQINMLSYTLNPMGIQAVQFTFSKAVASTITISFTVYYKNGQSLDKDFSIQNGSSTGTWYPDSLLGSGMDYIKINELNPNRDDKYQYAY